MMEGKILAILIDIFGGEQKKYLISYGYKARAVSGTALT
jgi:hypothetical protein